tara:strand:- start:1908 stop:2744 length:837 start_codon:yes stop_codon:yes gene_type:complete
MMSLADYKLEKNRIARSFAAAAGTYDAHASLQRSIANKLLAKLAEQELSDSSTNKRNKIKRILDLGSGTGYSTKALQNLFPSAEIISLDIAEAMLRHARELHLEDACNEKFVCADAEALPFNPGSFDLIFSSLAIQWCQNYTELFSELKRVLKPVGKIFIATFGPQTLQELKRAWLEVDSFVHVNQFHSERHLQSNINKNDFRYLISQKDKLLVYYQNFEELGRELKSIGARNMNQGRGKGLSGREKIAKLKAAFEKEARQGAGIPVTYQVFYLSAQG